MGEAAAGEALGSEAQAGAQAVVPKDAVARDKAKLPPRYLLLALVPVLILVLSDALLNRYGWPVAPRPATVIETPIFAYSESAARIRVLIGFMILVLAALSAVAYTVMLGTKAEPPVRWRLLLWAGALTLGALLYFQWPNVVRGSWGNTTEVQTQQLADQALMCRAAMMGEPEAVDTITHEPSSCKAVHFQELRQLVTWQRWCLAAALIAVVIGSILCLGQRQPNDHDPHEVQVQVSRLNTVLYLAAFMLVGGLFFLSAFLHYPTFALSKENATLYGEAAKMIVMFYAVSFSLLIASFYLPAAAILNGRWDAAKLEGAAKPDQGSGVIETGQLFRTGAAIIAPLLAGLLTEHVKLPGL